MTDVDSAAHPPGGIYDFIEEIDQKHESGHKRLRETLVKLGEWREDAEDRIGRIERAVGEHVLRLDVLDDRNVDADKVRFTPAMVIALLGLCVSIIGGQKWATQGLADQQAATTQAVALINAKMDAIKQHEDDYVKLQDERAARVTSEINRLSGQATMIDTKLSNLRETAFSAARR